MLTYSPGDSIAHDLDPRTKLAVQTAIAVAAFAHTTPRGLVVLTAITGVVVLVAALDLRAVLRELRWLFVLTALGPVFSVFVVGPPWVVLDRAVDPLLASYRVGCLLVVSVAYVHSTPVRESQAAIQWLVPGRPGRVLGLGVGLVFRFLPVIQADVARLRLAMRARGGADRPVRERIERLTIGGLARALDRVDTLTLALQARCLSWQPTLPPLSLGRYDYPALLFSGGLFVWTLI